MLFLFLSADLAESDVLAAETSGGENIIIVHVCVFISYKLYIFMILRMRSRVQFFAYIARARAEQHEQHARWIA